MKQKGQSLVEFCIILPILLVILVGLVEVGWALRGYLVLLNSSREVARFAVRPDYLNLNDEQRIWNHALTVTPLNDFEGKGDIVLSYIVVELVPISQTCTVTPAVYSPLTNITYTLKLGNENTKMDYGEISTKLVKENMDYSCKLAAKGGIPQDNRVVIVEMWYKQDQLLGFPGISNSLTNPVDLYAYTVMRQYKFR